MCDFKILGTEERNQKSTIMAAWFPVGLNALLSGNLFCWKLNTYNLIFPGGRWPLRRVLQPTQLFQLIVGCVFKDQCGKWHYKVSLPLYPFLFLDTEGKDQQEGWDLWVPRKLTTSQTVITQAHPDYCEGCSLDSICGAGLATTVSFPESFWLAQPSVL